MQHQRPNPRSGMESRKQQQQKCRIRVSAAACGPAMWLRATLPGLFTGQTDPHGQLTTDEMGDPAEHVRRTVHGRIRSSLRGHAIGGERYVVPFGGERTRSSEASAAVATEGGAAWLEAANTAFRARRRRRVDDDKSRRRRNSRLSRPRPSVLMPIPIESTWSQRGGWAAGRPARVLLRPVRSSSSSSLES